MTRLLMAGFLLVSVTAVADTQVRNKFKDGEVIKAEEFNENFDDLETAIDNIPAGATGPAGADGATGPAGPAGADGADGPQGEKGDTGDTGPQGATGPPGQYGEDGLPGMDGLNGIDGQDGVVNGVNCSEDQVIVYRGGAWVCSSPEYRTLDVLEAFGTLSCPSGKRVTGGGCRIRGLEYCQITHSKPSEDLSGWRCEAAGFVECYVEAIYAICQ